MKSLKQEEISKRAFEKRVYAAYMREQGKTYKEIAQRFNTASCNNGMILVRGYQVKMRTLVRGLAPLRDVLEMLAQEPKKS
jgi:hypothetical protein